MLRVIVATFRSVAFVGLCVVIATPVSAASLVASWDGTNLTLAPKPTRVFLQLDERTSPAGLANRAKTHRFTLVLGGLAADPDPETGYLVFLNLDEKAKSSTDDEGYVGAINFFGMPPTAAEPSRLVSFEISPTLVRLEEIGRLSGPISVTFVPTGRPAEGSRASVAKIDIYEN
ncbi:hypothetical protein [Methyloceanibacter sp.]|uniref:DUF7868 domain-containing protein n=1 Tax=Methyloceanibacter sp. TaxID=1965321 RepID=UPI003D6CBC93